MIDLTGKTALITGASGSIGSACARQLHKLGANIVLTTTSINKLEKLLSELPGASAKECNLEDLSSLSEVIASISKLDILVCNAGMTDDNLFLRMTSDSFKKVLDVNLVANYSLARDSLKKMMKNKWGRIINISSVVALSGNAGQSNYAASKAGLIAMSKSLAQEVATKNVTVNCVAPGFIVSNMTDKLNDAQKEHIMSKIPMKKFGAPEDIASAVAYLASEQAGYITGQVLSVNGGMLMQ